MENEHLIPLDELCTHYNIEFSFIHSLTEYGLVEITTIETKQYFYKEKIKDLEKMIRFHYELNINMEGIDVIAHLLQKVHYMQDELGRLQNQLKRYETE